MLNFKNRFAGASRQLNFHLSPLSRSHRRIGRRAVLGCTGAVLALLSPIAGLGQETGTATAPPVAYASVSELNGILDQVKQTATAIQTDLSKMRIEKWKTDSSNKRQTQGNADSVQRNLQSALPEITTQLHASPEDMAASFKLYRNLDALYDVFGSLVESAGAFGSKDEFQSLSNDMNGLESARRALGERIQKLAAAKEDELTRLRTQVKTLTAAPPPPPKKIVVDDTEPPKKPLKKKVAKPATTTKPATPGTQPPAATLNPAPTK
jgi:hypothetical protein